MVQHFRRLARNVNRTWVRFYWITIDLFFVPHRERHQSTHCFCFCDLVLVDWLLLADGFWDALQRLWYRLVGENGLVSSCVSRETKRRNRCQTDVSSKLQKCIFSYRKYSCYTYTYNKKKAKPFDVRFRRSVPSALWTWKASLFRVPLCKACSFFGPLSRFCATVFFFFCQRNFNLNFFPHVSRAFDCWNPKFENSVSTYFRPINSNRSGSGVCFCAVCTLRRAA